MNEHTPASSEGTQSLRRALSLLTALAGSNRDGASVAELAGTTGLNRTTAHRMLRCLHDAGFLRYVPSSRRYFLGRVAYDVGVAAAEQVKLRMVCAEAVARIAARTGSTVFLLERERYDAVCINLADGGRGLAERPMGVGDRRPLGVGTGALAILAAMDDAESAVRHNAERFCEYPGLSLSKVWRNLAHARSQGHVCSTAAGAPGIRRVGVALRTPDGRPIGALSVAAPERGMTERRVARLIAELQREARAMTRALASL